jgi:hypothetical protein
MVASGTRLWSEEVTGDEQQIDLVGQRPIDNALQDVPTALPIRGLLREGSTDVPVEMHVGRMQHAERSARRHGEQHATSREG